MKPAAIAYGSSSKRRTVLCAGVAAGALRQTCSNQCKKQGEGNERCQKQYHKVKDELVDGLPGCGREMAGV